MNCSSYTVMSRNLCLWTLPCDSWNNIDMKMLLHKIWSNTSLFCRNVYCAAISNSTLTKFSMKNMLKWKFYQGKLASKCPSSGYIMKSVGVTVSTVYHMTFNFVFSVKIMHWSKCYTRHFCLNAHQGIVWWILGTNFQIYMYRYLKQIL